MRKLLIGLMLFILPMSVMAAGDNATSTKVSLQGTTEEKKVQVQTMIDTGTALQDGTTVMTQDKEQIMEQTQEQLQTCEEEMVELKEQIRQNYSGIADLTSEEKAAMADEIAEMKSQVKDVQISNLYIRKGLSSSAGAIKDRVTSVVEDAEPTEEETNTIETILQDV